MNPLEAQIRELYGRVTYSHKAHEKCADILQARRGQIVFWQITLSAITTGSLLLAIFGEQRIGTIIGAILSTGLLALNTYTKDKDLNSEIERHSSTAKSLLSIRESYLSLLTDMSTGLEPIEKFIEKRDALEVQLQAVHRQAPRTNDKSYGQAQAALQKNEDLTFTDEELDSFLPSPLKRAKK